MYTPKQKALMQMWQTGKLKRLNLLEGSVSSGKTWISLVLWAFWVASMPKDKQYIMCAYTLTSLKTNCLILLQELVGEDNFSFSMSQKEGWLFGRRIRIEGANDERAESKIRGATYQGAYVDEASKVPKGFFAMLLSRLRLPGAKLFATTNPENPAHWLKTDYIDRADNLDFLDLKFLLDDNTMLDPDYVRNIKREYTGVFYDRFILGKWVQAEGLVYPMWEEALEHPPTRKAEKYALSIDYGTMNAFAANLWGRFNGVWYQLREYYYSGRDERKQKTDEEYANDLDAFITGYVPDGCEDNKNPVKFLKPGEKLLTIIDPSAASFIALLRKRQYYKVLKANNDVLDGIRETATAIHTGKLKINPECEATIFELQSYVWDESAGEDRPVKENDHCLTGETIVMTETGEAKIKDLCGKSGKVWSFNTRTCEPELMPFSACRCTQRNAKIYKIETDDGGVIRCTAEHPVLTQRGYVQAKDLKETDSILKIVEYPAQCRLIGVKRITLDGVEDVYNMEVEKNHNFAVNGGYIVHNCMDAIRYLCYTLHITKKQSEYMASLD